MFTISENAKAALASHARSNASEQLVPIVTWAMGEGLYDGEWFVGFIERDRIAKASQELICEVWHQIDGMEIIIDGPRQYQNFLRGTVLDFADGKFVFIPPASSHPR
jgi:hypothetical protein